MKATRTLLAVLLLVSMLLGVSALQPGTAAAEAPAAQARAALSGELSPTQVKTTMFNAKFEGSAVAGKGEQVDGVYRFTATETDGEAWHVKLECNYPTVSGRDYRVTYRFNSDVAGKIKFGDFQEFDIKEGENSVTGMMIASGGTSYLDLQLGMLPPFTIDFTEIEVEEFADEVDYENALETPVNFEKELLVYERHDQGYAPVFTRSSDGVSIEYLATAWDTGVWKSRLYINTGLIPEAGVRYRIRADVTCDGDMPFELLFNNDEVEKGYGALYGQSLTAKETKTVEAVIIGGGDGDELVLQFSLGEVPEGSTVKVENLHIDRIIDHYKNMLPKDFALDKEIATGKTLKSLVPTAYKKLPLPASFSYEGTDTVYEGHDGDYVVELEESATSATLKILQAPAEGRGVWKAKLYAATGKTLEPGATYQIKFDVSATADQAKYEACFDGDYENAYGALYGRSLTAGGTDHVEYTVTPDESHGPLTLRLQLGETDSTAGNNVTLSNISITKLSEGEAKEIELPDFAYPVGEEGKTEPNSFFLEANSGAQAELTGDGSSATATVTKPGDDWHVKLYAQPKYELEAGQTYTISMNVTGAAGCTACYKNTATGAEDGFGTEAIVDGTVTHTVTPEESGTLEILLKIGNVPEGTAVTVSDVKIEKADTGFIPVDLAGFGYPSVTPASTTKNSFDLETNEGTQGELTGDGSSATATVTKPGDDWHVKFYAKPGYELKAGKTYRISFDVTGAAGCTACYKNTAGEGEEGFGTETITDGTVTHEVTAEADGTLEILLKIGNVPAGTAVKMSNVKIAESKPVASSILPGAISYPDSFFLETNSGADAALSGEGGSATATVTKPGADWNVKFYVKPHTKLEAGKSYQVSLHVANAAGCPVCFKDLASGNEEGFGVEWLGSSDQTVTHTITPESEGELELLLKIGNVPEGTAVTVSNVQVGEVTYEFSDVELSGFAYPSTTPESVTKRSFDLESNGSASAKLGGDGSSATATILASGDDWHVKLYAKPFVSLEAGKRYLISMDVTGADGCTACYKNTATGAEDGFGTETISSGTVTHAAVPEDSGTLEILLKLGTLPAGTVVTVRNVQISEYKPGNVDVTPEDFAYPVTTPGSIEYNSFDLEANEGAVASLTGDGSSATATVTKPGDDWHVKFYAKPGVELEAGKTYRISFDVTGADGCTACYKNTATGAEDGFGTEPITSGTVTHTAAPTENGTLEILLKIGTVPEGTEVTVRNVKVEEIAFAPGEEILPSFSYDSTGSVNYAADGGYIVSLDKNSSSADFHIHQAPESGRNPWNVKLFVNTGFTPAANKGYRVSFDIQSEKDQSVMEVFYDGSSEAAYGDLFNQKLSAGQKKTVAYTIMPGASKGELNLQIRLGQTNGADGNNYTISNVKLEEVTFKTESRPEKKVVTTLWTHETYHSTLEKTPDKATVKVGKIPAEGREPWKTKLFVYTGTQLKQGEKYRISMIVKSIIPTPFEVCFNNGEEEKGLGAMFGLISKPSGQYVEYVTYAKQDTDLVIQLSLGNCAPPNSIILEKVAVEKAGRIDLVSDTVYTF